MTQPDDTWGEDRAPATDDDSLGASVEHDDLAPYGADAGTDEDEPAGGDR